MAGSKHKEAPPTEYDLLMQARHHTVNNAVELLKSIADLKEKVPRSYLVPGASAHSKETKAPVGRASDVLYELMQLQFTVGNRLAEMQGQYRKVALRSLERWYDAFAQAGKSECTELEFRGRGRLLQSVTLENRLGAERATARIEWEPLRGPRPMPPLDYKALLITVLNVETKRNDQENGVYDFIVNFGTPAILQIEINLDECVQAHRTLLHVHMEHKRQTISIVAKRDALRVTP